MERRIAVTQENREFLAKTFNCTKRMVLMALVYERNSELAKKIRKVAKERGGQEVVVAGAFETFHDADGVMRQYFENGAMIELDKRTGKGTVTHKGIVRKEYTDVKVVDIADIQEYAEALK